jgi:hypothetical protein
MPSIRAFHVCGFQIKSFNEAVQSKATCNTLDRRGIRQRRFEVTGSALNRDTLGAESFACPGPFRDH